MSKVAIRTVDSDAKPSALPHGYAGHGLATAYFDGADGSLHLHKLEVADGKTLQIGPDRIDRLAYVWRGAISAGGSRLEVGSSFIVEAGAVLETRALDGMATLLAFAAALPRAVPVGGGNVHLLRVQDAPRSDNLGDIPGLGGVMHADADCDTCALWLHENHFPAAITPRTDAEAGIHSHSEDEIIFVIDGEIRLGNRLYGPGTAIAIAADTLYSFTAGPNGLGFINFRAGKPGDIRFARGGSISETQYWRERLPRPRYLSPLR